MIGPFSLNLGARVRRSAPLSPKFQYCFNRPPVDQPPLSTTFKTVKNRRRKMFPAFSNNRNSINIANSFNSAAPNDNSQILEWLSPLEPRVRHRDIAAHRQNGIGTWLLETEEFRRWQNASREGESVHATLFCDGDPGVGKSYIV